ncbi:AN1-type zinc finger protein 2A isoform X6 [Nannospalax galili]|uniref:AN1-type zinc finger protein 2A isoform X6 n=1 Tax=Nannospalax galili TaxID=1026970 RepID=UPI00111C6C67|nr:AN1-type zinc finger protein 2A isoform X6 [Nannospalax galili]
MFSGAIAFQVILDCHLCLGRGFFIMEFPDLGKHCSEQTCKQLDFLPITCDACKQDFCKDHFSYAAHKCPFAFKKNVQVPICPLCSIPVPVKRGENPDVVVGEHMDRDCTSHPGRKKEKEGWNPRMCRCPPAGDTSQSLVQTPPYTGRFMQTGSLTEPRARLGASGPSHPASIHTVLGAQPFTQVPGIEIQHSHLHRKHSYPLSCLSPAPGVFVFFFFFFFFLFFLGGWE